MNTENKNTGLRISDNVLMKFIELTQLALLTGTDVVDYLRMLRLKEGDGEFVLADGQKELFDRQVDQLVADLKTKQGT